MQEISVLKKAQSHFEENMKKAFMRGVCALNMEAMTMFHDPPSSHGTPPPTTTTTYNRTEHLPGAPPIPSYPVGGVQPSGTASLNMRLENGVRKFPRKVKPSVTVERHVPSN